MTPATEFLASLRARGIELTPKATAPRTAKLTAEDRALLKEHRPRLRQILEARVRYDEVMAEREAQADKAFQAYADRLKAEHEARQRRIRQERLAEISPAKMSEEIEAGRVTPADVEEWQQAVKTHEHRLLKRGLATLLLGSLR